MQKINWRKVIISGLVLGSITITGSTIWGQTYYVQPGDSLYNIAARFGTTITALQQSNGLSSTTLYPGQALNIRQGSVPTSAGASYTVKPGDSLYLVAQRYGITVEALKQANQIYNNNLWVGQTLRIPASGGTVATGTSSHLVKSGDTFYLIAKQYGISMTELLKANNLTSSAQLYPGQRLTIPKAGSTGGVSTGNYNLSTSDMNLLARLVSAESAGEPFEGQVAVASTILNRLKDPRYPKTIPGIVYQIDYGRYQYSPVLDGRINLPASASAIKAVQQALNGWDPSNGANGFYNPSKTTNQWVRSHPVTAVIGDHVFFNY